VINLVNYIGMTAKQIHQWSLLSVSNAKLLKFLNDTPIVSDTIYTEHILYTGHVV